MLRTKAVRDAKETQREMVHREIALQAALEGIVLLKNDGALPVSPGKIALYGAGGEKTIKGGTGSGEVNERRSVSILEGLETAGYTITTKDWIRDYAGEYRAGLEAYKANFSKSLSRFQFSEIANLMANPFRYPYGRKITEEDIRRSETNVCLYVVARQAGEGADRKLDNGDYSLTEIELDNLRICSNAYEKTIVAINVGAAFDLSFLEEIPGINGLFFFCQQGTEGGTAFAKLLSGEVTPSGKLTDTWAKRYEDIPFSGEFSYLNGDLENEAYREGIYVGYRYFDTFGVQPRFPFGFGLSYTSFETTFLGVKMEQTEVVLDVRVTNKGDTWAGKEVVQAYVSCPQSGLAKPWQQLAAFKKTRTIAPGESQDLTLRFRMADLSVYREETGCFELEAGDYIIRIGSDSRHTVPQVVLSLHGTVAVSRHAHICPQQTPVDEIVAPLVIYEDDLQDTVRVQVAATAFSTMNHDYGIPQKNDSQVEALLSTLIVSEQATLVVGAGMGSMFLGGGYFQCPGAVGNTTSKLVGKGILNIPFSDGPAGLRLQKTSALRRNGKIRPIDAPIEFLNYMPGLFKRFLFGNAEKDTLLYQFTTAFPVELALAQSWNEELLEEVGHAIGIEMVEYGIAFWLAPALNIHRNPLCGRNFEYYSEDPYLSGKLAAAAVRGCQGVGGVYATIKHFCANNQEDNRNRVSSNLSERTLREIYLRGFEIAVREGGAKAVMTSYNKVNGTYTPNSHDLCTKVLRNEWGFDGVVMTDWFSTGKGLADNGRCMKAGNDLVMPGGGYYRKQILKACKEGRITDADIRRCAGHVLRSILDSRIFKELSVKKYKNGGTHGGTY